MRCDLGVHRRAPADAKKELLPKTASSSLGKDATTRVTGLGRILKKALKAGYIVHKPMTCSNIDEIWSIGCVWLTTTSHWTKKAGTWTSSGDDV